MRFPRVPLVLTTVAPALLACAGPARFQAGRQVDVEPHALGNQYKQDGKQVEVFSMMDGLAQVDEARADATSARNWMIAGVVLGAAGGGALGYGVVSGATGHSTGWAFAGAGAGLAAVSLLFARPVDRHLESAIESYNRKAVPQRAPSSAHLLPAAAPVCDARGRCGAGAGFALAF